MRLDTELTIKNVQSKLKNSSVNSLKLFVFGLVPSESMVLPLSRWGGEILSENGNDVSLYKHVQWITLCGYVLATTIYTRFYCRY